MGRAIRLPSWTMKPYGRASKTEGKPEMLRCASDLLLVVGVLRLIGWLVHTISGETSLVWIIAIADIAAGIGLFYAIRYIRYVGFLLASLGLFSAYVGLGSDVAAAWMNSIYIVLDAAILAFVTWSILKRVNS